MNNDEFGISRDVLDKIKKLFLEYKEIEKVALIGSRAKGNYQKGSDIDLVIWGSKLNFSDYLKLISDLEELDIPYKVDVIKYDLIGNDNIKEHIQRVGKQLYVKNQNV